MSINVLNIVSNAMTELELNYRFMEWKKKPSHPYFTGEYQETTPMNEDGEQDSTFIINGFTRGDWLELEEAKEKIEKHFSRVSGRTVMAEPGSAVAVFYENSMVVPQEDAELKRIQINLLVKEWKVN